MTRYISLLRGINVSGQKPVRMDELKSVYESLELEQVSTYIQSGNVVFSSKTGRLRERIEVAIAEHFGFEVPVLVLSADAVKTILADNPFLSITDVDVSKLHVTFLDGSAGNEAGPALQKLARGNEAFHIGNHEIYLYCPDGYGRSKLTNTNLEKATGKQATTRNWKTVSRLYDMAVTA